MSAVNSLQSPEALRAEPQQTEPSMEEILASIRRIIADDHSLPEHPGLLEAAAQAPADEHHRGEIAVSEPPPMQAHAPPHIEAQSAGPAALQEADPVAALAAAMAHGSIAAPQYANPDGPHSQDPPAAPHQVEETAAAPQASVADHVSAEEEEQSERRPVPPHGAIPGEPQGFDEPMKDGDATRRAGGAVAEISGAVQNSVVSAFNMLAAARLVDDPEQLRSLVKSMLQPMLVAWLNDHLPGLVERAVRDEIERVARGAR